MTKCILAPIAVALAVAGCGGDSAADVAREQVCDARANISRQIDALSDLTPASATADAVRGSVESIGADLRKIRDAQGSLSDERRQDVQAANDAFTAQIRGIGSTILRSTSVEEARTQLSAAVTQLGESYRATLGTIGCN
jgi:hypothetical protein